MATLLAVFALIGATRSGRYLARRSASGARAAALRLVGGEPPRSEVEADWADRRNRGVVRTGEMYREIYDEANPELRRLLDYAGLDPDRAVVRWGNYDKVFVLPGAVFEADDSGRSYRMRPEVRSVWLKGVALPRGVSGFFLVPDTPDLTEVLKAARVSIVPGSGQSTNSWGFRGPEPDLSAPIRGLVLGDSNMQGLLVGDSETPPECLARELEARLKTRVSILNTGTIGYSPEQFCRVLEDYAGRFRPQFVLLTLCVNDFGDGAEGTAGKGDWDEGKYWLDRIEVFCRARNILCVISPVPYDHQVTGVRRVAGYPGQIERVAKPNSLDYCFPIEDLADEFLRLSARAERGIPMTSANPLYNGHLGDHHLSPLGCRIWGRALGRRIALLLEVRQARGLMVH